jgi:hypothetical protein
MDELIPMTAIVLAMGVAFWSMYLEHQKKQLQFRERQLMIEKGLTPPPMLPDEPKRRTPADALRRGLILVFLGLGFAVASVVGGTRVDDDLGGLFAVAAAIVGFIGLGNLVYYFIARDTAQNADIAPLS